MKALFVCVGVCCFLLAGCSSGDTATATTSTTIATTSTTIATTSGLLTAEEQFSQLDCPQPTGDKELPSALIGCWTWPDTTRTEFVFTGSKVTYLPATGGSPYVCDYVITEMSSDKQQGRIALSGPECLDRGPDSNISASGGDGGEELCFWEIRSEPRCESAGGQGYSRKK